MKKFTLILFFSFSFLIYTSLSGTSAEKGIIIDKDLTVQIISPKEGEKVHGNITIEARVNHPEAVKYCEFYIQEPEAQDRYGWKDYFPPYFWGGDGHKLDTTLFDDGQASAVVFVYSGDNRSPRLQKRVHFIIDNGKPDVKIRSPKDHDIIKGNVLIHVDAGDLRSRNQDAGMFGVFIYVDGGLIHKLTQSPFKTTLYTCLLMPGAHLIRVVGEDTDGLKSSDSIVVIVDHAASATANKKVTE
ncbi:MAG: hypothetical protein A2Y81_04440 [Nitrospirae bacterium RBG_13_43_8]|nr:MAG: hypothetical protein A2Y81_04440 [Nitrospirae bacterium RBG_13_43_8]